MADNQKCLGCYYRQPKNVCGLTCLKIKEGDCVRKKKHLWLTFRPVGNFIKK